MDLGARFGALFAEGGFVASREEERRSTGIVVLTGSGDKGIIGYWEFVVSKTSIVESSVLSLSHKGLSSREGLGAGRDNAGSGARGVDLALFCAPIM
jgi:hypothetical protein